MKKETIIELVNAYKKGVCMRTYAEERGLRYTSCMATIGALRRAGVDIPKREVSGFREAVESLKIIQRTH